MTKNQALGMLRYSSRLHHLVSLCCILKPHVEHNWVLNNMSIVQCVLSFWSISLFSLSFWAKCWKWFYDHWLLYSNLTLMWNKCFDPLIQDLWRVSPSTIQGLNGRYFNPNECFGYRQFELPCTTSQTGDIRKIWTSSIWQLNPLDILIKERFQNHNY